MNSNLLTLNVDESVEISDVLHSFTSTDKDVLLFDVNSVITEPHRELLTDYPRSVTTALVAPHPQGDIRIGQDRIRSAASDFHQIGSGGHLNLGMVRLSQKQRTEIIEILSKIQNTDKSGSVIDLIIVALVRSSLVVAPAIVVGAPFIRSKDAAARDKVRKEIADLNDARLRLKLANRANDGFFSVFFLRKFSKLFTWVAVRTKMTPNQVTLISFAVGLLSAYQFSFGQFWNTLFGAVLLQLSIIIDCVDGELARYTRQFSQLGAWLDAITDRIKEYAVYFTLAYGAEKNGINLWIPAIGMMLFQSVRHISDYNFARVNKIRKSHLDPIPFDQKSDLFIPTEKEKLGRFKYWAKKVVQFPIGERWLAISATSVIGGAKFTFIVMPILSLISIGLVFRGRVRTSLTWPKDRTHKTLIDSQLDLLGKSSTFSRFDWLEPSILRLIEGGLYICATVLFDLNLHQSFMIIFAILFGHYDSMYRALAGEKKPQWLTALGLSIPGRLLLIGLFVIYGLSLQNLVYYFGALYFFIASFQWIAANVVKGK